MRDTMEKKTGIFSIDFFGAFKDLFPIVDEFLLIEEQYYWKVYPTMTRHVPFTLYRIGEGKRSLHAYSLKQDIDDIYKKYYMGQIKGEELKNKFHSLLLKMESHLMACIKDKKSYKKTAFHDGIYDRVKKALKVFVLILREMEKMLYKETSTLQSKTKIVATSKTDSLQFPLNNFMKGLTSNTNYECSRVF